MSAPSNQRNRSGLVSERDARERVDPAEAFSLLANETRLAVLLVLADADERSLRFSELRERVGDVDAGNFAYHLDRLTGVFVDETEGGYTLTPAGARIVDVVHTEPRFATEEYR